jgi:peroxiredoxin
VSLTELPEGLPEPVDDGACDHLVGRAFPSLALSSSSGGEKAVNPALSVLYVFPMIGTPGVDLPDGWDLTPGARGCSVQSLAYSRAFESFAAVGARVYGVSSQPTSELVEARGRLELPQELLSDAAGALRAALDLPVFEVGGVPYLRRVAIGIRAGVIEHVSYPIFPPGSEIPEVLDWLAAAPRS